MQSSSKNRLQNLENLQRNNEHNKSKQSVCQPGLQASSQSVNQPFSQSTSQATINQSNNHHLNKPNAYRDTKAHTVRNEHTNIYTICTIQRTRAQLRPKLQLYTIRYLNTRTTNSTKIFNKSLFSYLAWLSFSTFIVRLYTCTYGREASLGKRKQRFQPDSYTHNSISMLLQK